MDLSVLIPARNEEWLGQTIADVLKHAEVDTEIVVVLDGAWPDTPLAQHPKVQIVYVPEPIGQRAATNLAAKVARGRYVMKLDAHASMGQGFDRILIEAGDRLGPEVTQVPAQRNLHVFNRVCSCGKVEYQGPMHHPCVVCGKTEWTKEVVWKPRGGTTTSNWTFDSQPKFQYGGAPLQPEIDGIRDVMSALGACFFIRRDRYFDLGGFDEAGGFWGSYAIELACKSWLSGGRHVVNTRTTFSHFFRVGGIGFSYPIKGSDQEKARDYARDVWFNNRWSGQVRPLSWLLDKFWPVRGWSDEDRARVADAGASLARKTAQPTKGLVYYSDSRPDPTLLLAVRNRLRMVAGDMPIVSVTLQPVEGLGQNIHLPLERGYLAMFKQILEGLEALDTDVAFLVEHDVAYHPSHFDFTPPRDDTFYYNQNVWKVDADTGRALHYRCSQTSGLCANRKLLIDHYRKRVAIVEAKGYSRSMGFEPGTHNRPERVDDYQAETWMSEWPNVDIRHDANLTPSRWKREQFRNQKYTEGWTESDRVPGWGVTLGRFDEFLQEHCRETQQAIA